MKSKQKEIELDGWTVVMEMLSNPNKHRKVKLTNTLKRYYQMNDHKRDGTENMDKVWFWKGVEDRLKQMDCVSIFQLISKKELSLSMNLKLRDDEID